MRNRKGLGEREVSEIEGGVRALLLGVQERIATETEGQEADKQFHFRVCRVFAEPSEPRE